LDKNYPRALKEIRAYRVLQFQPEVGFVSAAALHGQVLLLALEWVCLEKPKKC
jgi:hypothetical protein